MYTSNRKKEKRDSEKYNRMGGINNYHRNKSYKKDKINQIRTIIKIKPQQKSNKPNLPYQSPVHMKETSREKKWEKKKIIQKIWEGKIIKHRADKMK